MLSETAFRRVVRASALYDLVVTAPFATPWTFLLVMGLIGQLHVALGLPGQVPVFDATHVLSGNLMGSVIVVWSLARLHLALPILGRYDATARVLFTIWQIYAVLNGASPLLLVLTVFEIGFGIAQLLPLVANSEQSFADRRPASEQHA